MSTKAEPLLIAGKRYLLTCDAAKVIGASPKTLDTARCRPDRYALKIPWVIISGRTYYAEEDLQAHLASKVKIAKKQYAESIGEAAA